AKIRAGSAGSNTSQVPSARVGGRGHATTRRLPRGIEAPRSVGARPTEEEGRGFGGLDSIGRSRYFDWQEQVVLTESSSRPRSSVFFSVASTGRCGAAKPCISR